MRAVRRWDGRCGHPWWCPVCRDRIDYGLDCRACYNAEGHLCEQHFIERCKQYAAYSGSTADEG